MILGLDSNRVVLLREHDAWAELFAQERDRMVAALAPHAVTVEHVGSTSIPGVPAKPILDIVIGVPNFEQAFVHVAPMEALGYTFRGEFGIPRRHYFVKGDPRSHHVHMVEIAGPGWKNTLDFREALRKHPGRAQQYSEAKQELARIHAQNRDTYQREKDAVVESLLGSIAGIPGPIDKVLAYITAGSRLVVFTEPHYPQVGTRVPGGSVEPGETANEAVLREAAEETGLEDLRIERFLGSQNYRSPRGRLHRRHFFHLQCTGDAPEAWEHWEQTPHNGEGPILFAHRWAEIGRVPELAAEQGALLDRL